jgi:hypothetical protein
VLGLIITGIVVLPVAALLFFALHRMERLKSLKVSVKFAPLPVLSFEASAEDDKKELPPPWGREVPRGASSVSTAVVEVRGRAY